MARSRGPVLDLREAARSVRDGEAFAEEREQAARAGYAEREELLYALSGGLLLRARRAAGRAGQAEGPGAVGGASFLGAVREREGEVGKGVRRFFVVI